MNLTNIKAVITGGVSGLGFAVAQKFVAEGGKVALLDVNADKAQAAVDELGADKARFFQVDVTSESDVIDVVGQAHDWMGGLNVAMNCAGILGAGRVLGREAPMPLDTFSKTVMVNLVGSFNVAKAAADRMQHNEPGEDNERGVIINTASVAAFEGQIGQAAYSASKGGVVGMTLPMAREFTRIGVRVMTIAPGVFHTPMVDIMPEQVQQALGESIPFPKRLGHGSEFADLAAHIVENRYFNGTTIRLDGAVRLEPK
ncbi:SDR family NAD(P)-dependent oxidoreductase [Wenzhouxiangella marina]|uniref:3-hydroxy-2-methylbutyryl-CoA dehydrogenase n=1 Tax=Wenzhouxiangella marina TaxID=1579979 RepID=A0A0K0XY19_9GAMM|nr:SDR family NAD(P)-dependent oxidoreductase [Wenzhouxiangella marina]AKS42570.1 3-hydroxy-2-methylbutyryl-CoA dehydrogenase [Wenzhouxiangella marina]MBB6085648.1 NAD(P)-dependent dehydrogenase (short-subunit alcohol dehydrogenase family) [Wenzhouxiangella marina]